MREHLWVGGSFALLAATAALAQPFTINVPGADGSDNALNVTTSQQINLTQAVTMSYAAFQAGTPSPTPGAGVYIPEQWAVVFRYSSVNIASGATLTFANHPSHAPVMWLVSGNVTINGTVSLDGANAYAAGPGLIDGGPGGFRGGRGWQSRYQPSGAGLGPGGGHFFPGTCFDGVGASYAEAGTISGGGTRGSTYGNEAIIPLIGGSGGSSWYRGGCNDSVLGAGGGGGGSALVAVHGALSVGPSAAIHANGGNGANNNASGGSGGAVRLVAGQIAGGGAIRALAGTAAFGGVSSVGRIRVEAANTDGYTENGIPTISFAELQNGATATIFPSAAPTVQVVSIGIANVPVDPRPSVSYANTDVHLQSPAPQVVTIRTENVPPNWTVELRVVPVGGVDLVATAAFDHVDGAYSIWTIPSLSVPPGVTVFQARAHQ